MPLQYHHKLEILWVEGDAEVETSASLELDLLADDEDLLVSWHTPCQAVLATLSTAG
jgi:hypothetical protein